MRERLVLDMWRVCIFDSRGEGRLVRLLTYERGTPGTVRAAAAERVRPVVKRLKEEFKGELVLASGILGGFAGVGNVAASWLVPQPWNLAAVIAVVPVVWVMWELAWLRAYRARYRGRHVEVALGAGLCPWCLYTLEGVPRREDGAWVCPECGGVWRG